MTITNEGVRTVTGGDGTSDQFAYGFRVDDEDDMTVYLDDVKQSSGWTMDGVGGQGGWVYFTTPPALGVRITMQRETPVIQEVDYQPYDPFPANTHEFALDKLTMICQELRYIQKNKVLVLPVDTASGVDPTVAEPSVNKALMWAESGGSASSLRNSAYDIDAVLADLISRVEALEG